MDFSKLTDFLRRLTCDGGQAMMRKQTESDVSITQPTFFGTKAE